MIAVIAVFVTVCADIVATEVFFEGRVAMEGVVGRGLEGPVIVHGCHFILR